MTVEEINMLKQKRMELVAEREEVESMYDQGVSYAGLEFSLFSKKKQHSENSYIDDELSSILNLNFL